MAISLQLDEEQERRALESADRRDEGTLRRILSRALERTIRVLIRSPPEEKENTDSSDFEALATRLQSSFTTSTKAAPLPTDALTREDIYGDSR